MSHEIKYNLPYPAILIPMTKRTESTEKKTIRYKHKHTIHTGLFWRRFAVFDVLLEPTGVGHVRRVLMRFLSAQNCHLFLFLTHSMLDVSFRRFIVVAGCAGCRSSLCLRSWAGACYLGIMYFSMRTRNARKGSGPERKQSVRAHGSTVCSRCG